MQGITLTLHHIWVGGVADVGDQEPGVIAIVGFVIVVLTFLVGDGLLLHIHGLFMRRFKWDPEPFVDADRKIKVGVSHGYDKPRTITEAFVAAPQSLIRRLLALIHRERMPRLIHVVSLDGSRTIAGETPEIFTGVLPPTASLPQQNMFRIRKNRDPEDVRLLVVVQVGRRGMMTRKLQRDSGRLTSETLEGSSPVVSDTS